MSWRVFSRLSISLLLEIHFLSSVRRWVSSLAAILPVSQLTKPFRIYELVQSSRQLARWVQGRSTHPFFLGRETEAQAGK